MLALLSASAGYLKGSAFLGLKVAYFHASSICCEKRADKFRSYYRGDGHKDYVNYVKRKRRAAEKRDCLRWRSCEIYICDFDQLYWSRGMNLRKMRKQWSPGRHTCYKDFYDFDAQFGTKNKKRCGQHASRKDPFEFVWQTADPFYTNRGDFFHEDFPFFCSSPFTRGKRGDFFDEDFSFAHGSPFTRGKSNGEHYSCNTDDNPGKRKVKVEPQTIGSPSDRQTLGLSPSGSLTIEELKKAFRAAALKWHPDRHEDAAKVRAEAKFKDCGAAYKSLLNALSKSC